MTASARIPLSVVGRPATGRVSAVLVVILLALAAWAPGRAFALDAPVAPVAEPVAPAAVPVAPVTPVVTPVAEPVTAVDAGWHDRAIQQSHGLNAVRTSSLPPPGWSAGAVSVGAGAGRASGSRRVREVQRRLRRLGYGVGAVDGVFGPRTRAAVAWFQLGGDPRGGLRLARGAAAVLRGANWPRRLRPRLVRGTGAVEGGGVPRASYARHLEGTTDDPYFATLRDGVPALGRAAAARIAALQAPQSAAT